MKNNLKVKIIILMAILTISCFGGLILYAKKSADSEKLPVIKKAYDFALLNQAGEKICLSQFRDKVKVMSFIYVKCSMPSLCPMTTKNFTKLQGLLGEYNKKVVFFCITFDPQSDTPGALKEYGQIYGADFGNLHFLTGTPDAIDKVCDHYGIVHEREESGSIRHSVITFLIDGKDNIRKMYFANEWEPEEIKKDIVTLLGDKK